MGNKSLHDSINTELAVPRIVTKLFDELAVIPVVGTLEDLVNLVGCCA